MAISGTEVEFVGPGIRANNPENRSYVQNMVFSEGTWQTRSGFGTLGEFSTTLSKYTDDPGILEQIEGYRTHVGSYLMTTNFGHRQIVSVFYSLVWNSLGTPFNDGRVDPFNISKRVPSYIVSIYDLTSRERWEELIYQYTSEISANNPTNMPYTKGYYQSSRDETVSVNKLATDEDQISFSEFNDTLYFGSKSMGFYSYRPAAFTGNTNKAVETLCNAADTPGPSESSILARLVLAEGNFADAYVYQTAIAGLTGLSKLGNRLVYITDTALYFSDNNFPSSVVAGHSISVPSESPITACREINGNLLIFTYEETFLYQPTSGFFVNAGQLTKISESIGCLSINSITKFDNTLAWVSSRGVYVNNGGLEVKSISENIKPFFNSYLSNPISHFNTQNGKANQTYKLPAISHRLDANNVTVCYSNTIKALMITIPKQRITLIHNQNGEWSIWNYDSMAFSNIEGAEPRPTNKVGIRDFMKCDQIVADEHGIYAIAVDPDSIHNKISSDQASTINRGTGAMEPDIDRNQAFSTYFILEYGRGGGLDRSIHDEDYRYGIGEWNQAASTPSSYKPVAAWNDQSTSSGYFWDFIIGKPQKILQDWNFDGMTVTSSGAVLIPIQVRIPVVGIMGTYAAGALPTGTRLSRTTKRTKIQDGQIYKLYCEFEFDSAHWVPMLAGTKIKALFKTPMECSQSAYGNTSINYAMVAGSEIQLYDTLTGLPSATGNLIRIAWDPAVAGTAAASNFANIGTTFSQGHFQVTTQGPGTTHNIGLNETTIPINGDEIKTLMWIPFMRRGEAEAVSSMAIEQMRGHMCTDNNAAPESWRSRNYWFGFSSLGATSDVHKEDNVTQAVDWAYASEPIGLGKGSQIKARGLYSEIKSHGMSGEHFTNGWTSDTSGQRNYRLFNATVAADNSQWMGQIVDQPSDTVNPTAIETSDSKTFLGFPSANNPQEESIRTKIKHIPAGQTIGTNKYKVFDSDAMVWGDNNTDTGTVLIDDPQFGTIADSTSTRGEWVNWMFFGYVLDKAEKLFLRSAKAVVRTVSGRRRKGHSGGQD